SGDRLEFASELRALPRGEIDLDALEAFLAFNSIPAPLTIFGEAQKLPPGYLLIWENGGHRLERFARPAPAPADRLREDDEAELLAERTGGLARLARPLVERLPTSSARASFDYKAKRFVRAAHLPPLERHHGWKEIFSPDARAELTGRRSGFDPVHTLRDRFAETEGAELLARLQDVDLGIYLVDDLLVKTDRASMAHSLEARLAFRDPVVTHLALMLPTRHRVSGLRKKVLLRKAVAPLLPDQIVKGKKRGFSIPAAAWLRGELEPFARDTLSADTLRRQGFFQPEPVARLIDRHVSGKEDLS